jgi:hypothetical protein
MNWNTENMVELLVNFADRSKIKIQPGEDGHWTDSITVKMDENDEYDNYLFLGGFTDDDIPGTVSDTEIDRLYLHDRSGDGLRSKNKRTRELYFNIKDKLEELGYEVVENPDDYF